MVVFRGKQLRGGRALAPALSGAHTAGGNKHACHERGLANPAQLGSPSLRPQEIKPNLGMIMNNLSILLATARHLDEPLNATCGAIQSSPRLRSHHRLAVSPPASSRTHLTGTRSPARGRLPWGCLIISTSLSQMRSTEKTVVSNAEALDWLSSGASN